MCSLGNSCHDSATTSLIPYMARDVCDEAKFLLALLDWTKDGAPTVNFLERLLFITTTSLSRLSHALAHSLTPICPTVSLCKAPSSRRYTCNPNCLSQPEALPPSSNYNLQPNHQSIYPTLFLSITATDPVYYDRSLILRTTFLICERRRAKRKLHTCKKPRSLLQQTTMTCISSWQRMVPSF